MKTLIYCTLFISLTPLFVACTAHESSNREGMAKRWELRSEGLITMNYLPMLGYKYRRIAGLRISRMKFVQLLIAMEKRLFSIFFKGRKNTSRFCNFHLFSDENISLNPKSFNNHLLSSSS